MKTKNVVLVVVAIVASATLAFAGSPSKMVVINANKVDLYKVFYEGSSSSKVELQITDNKGNILLSETITGINKFMRPVNFTELEPGVYNIITKDENGVQTQQIRHKMNPESATETTAYVATSHVSKLQDGRFLLSVAGKGTGKVNITITDGNDHVIYRDNITVTDYKALVYNLKQVEGKPLFEIASAK